MNRRTKRCFIAIVAPLLIAISVSAGETNDTDTMLFVLSDGTRLLGSPITKAISVETSHGSFSIPLSLVEKTVIGKERDTVVRLTNGDVLSGRFSADEIRVNTLLGSLVLPASTISEIVRPRRERVILFDLASGSFQHLQAAADGVNKVQVRFQCVAMKGPAFAQAIHKVGGHPNFFIDEVPKEAFTEAGLKPSDLVLVFVKHPLTGKRFGSHFMSAGGQQRGRLVFVSTAWNKRNANAGRCTLAEVVSHSVVARLVCEYTDMGFHKETRSCPMDYCRVQTQKALSLAKRQFCKECKAAFADAELAGVLASILKWREDKDRGSKQETEPAK